MPSAALSVASAGFAAAALSAVACGIWSLRSHAEPASTPQIRTALFATALWAIVLGAAGPDPGWRWLPLAELLRYLAWLLAMPVLIGATAGRWLGRLNLLLWAGCAVLALASPVLSLLLLAVAGLVNVEQLLRNAQPVEKRAMNLCVLGLGGLFAYDLFLYSELVLLDRPPDQAWSLRGFVNAALLLPLTLGVARLSRTGSKLFVSRQAMFYSTAFVSIGLYLLAMAMAAHYVRDRTGAWGAWLQPLLILGSGLVLIALFSAQSPWRRLRVFLSKHFYRNKYDYRVEWLRFVRTLSETQERDARVTSVRAIAQILESSAGMLFLRDEGGRHWPVAAQWTADGSRCAEPAPLPEGHEMIGFMEQKEWVIDIDEHRRSPEVYQSIALPEFLTDPAGHWRVVSPLFGTRGLQGFLVLRQPPEPFAMTFEDRDLLRMVGRHVATLLAQQAADHRLAESRQFDAFNRFAAFVMHDLKNSAAQLRLLVSNAARHRNNPEFIDDAFATIDNTAARITRLIEQFHTRDSATAQRPVDLSTLLATALQRCSERQPAPSVGKVPEASWVLAEAERLTTVFEHVLRNALDAAGPDGKVTVRTEVSGPWITVSIGDSGPGMEPEFVRDRLFRPFDTTKGSRGMGIGAYQAREYVLQLGGSVEVQSKPGEGTWFFIRLPLCQKNDNNAS
jgi:putative PEP-CTERM system histidine kinase